MTFAIKYLFLLAFMIGFFLLMSKLTNYDGRMNEYNHHMCVEVYGLNDQCK